MSTNDKCRKTPWLSVIVPIYNAEKYLEKCIKSVLNQSFTGFELLLVDDGSTDGSADICRKYTEADSRVRYFKKANGGPFAARLYGAERAAGAYITFCDADDYYTTKAAFAFLRAKAVKTNFDCLQFCFYKRYNHLKRAGKNVKAERFVGEDEFLRDEYPKLLCSFWDTASISPSTYNKVYKRALFENAPNSKTVKRIFWGDDLILNLFVLENCKSMLFVPNHLYAYRQTSGGTKRFSKTTMRDLDNIKLYQLEFLQRRGIKEDKERIKATLFFENAMWFFLYVRQGLKALPEEELRALITETLSLKSFELCRDYYLERKDDKRIGPELLRIADPDRYIAEARAYKEKRKKALSSILKKIYARI